MDIYQWIVDFLGVNNTYNDFSTKMYNFWSGFGGNISILALIGAMIGVYRHNLKRLDKLRHFDQINPLQKPFENIIRKVENSGSVKPNGSDDKNGPDGKNDTKQ